MTINSHVLARNTVVYKNFANWPVLPVISLKKEKKCAIIIHIVIKQFYLFDIFMTYVNNGKRAVNRMIVTDIRIRKVNTEGRMKAIVSVTFDDAFAVHDIKVVEGDKGLFVAMPSKRMPDGEYKDIAHPISSAAREMIQSAVLKEYEAVLATAAEEKAIEA